MNFKCLFCGALITLYVGVAEAVNYVPENISASISLKVPGNVAERYSLNLQQLGNNRSSYLLEASESIPFTITQRVADISLPVHFGALGGTSPIKKSHRFCGGLSRNRDLNPGPLHYLGSIQTGKLILELSDITIPENQLTMNGTWYVAHENASYYNVDNGSMQTMIGMLYNLVGGKLVCNLISSVLDGLAFQADGNIIARYAPLPDSVRIGSLIGNYIKHPANDWNASPPNLATYYVNDNTSLYVIPQIDMIIRQVMINRQTKANSGDSSMENALLAAYQKINTWSTTGIKMTIRESEDPAKGDLILLLDKSEIQELFALLEIVKVFIPEETLNAPVMDLIGNLIPPQFVSIAAILLKGKTFGAILNQLSQELNTIPIEIGIYLYKDKNIN